MKEKVFDLKNNIIDVSTLAISLEKYGWSVIDNYSGELLSLMERVCYKMSLIISSHTFKKLTPKECREVEYFSLSSAYGLNEFPLHTDGVAMDIPPRFIVLRALSSSPTGTKLADANEIKEQLNIKNSKWSFKTNTGILKTSLYTKHPKYSVEYLRFNRLSMKCTLGNKLEIIDMIDKLKIIYVDWTDPKTLIIDNWRVLHGRQGVIEKDYKSRVIERLQVFI
jgi:hypothetical protein